MDRELRRGVLFDWDGTLLNSAEASFRCYVRLFESFGILFDRTHFERTYSPNWYRTYAEVGLPESRWPEADTRWLDYYAREENRLVPGALEALVRLRNAGFVQGLVTSADRQRVTRELNVLNLEPYFQAVVCSEDARMKKPHPEALLLALRLLGIRPTDAAYIGDSPEDVEMARSARVYSIGVPGDFPNREALAAACPDLMVPTLREAVGALVGSVVPGGNRR